MPTPKVPPEQRKRFIEGLQQGHNIKDASEYAGFSYSTGKRLHKTLQHLPQAPKLSQPLPVPAPLQPHELSPVALDCLDDFGRFRARYFGRISSPWQEDAAQKVLHRLQTPNKEYGVVNCPPGSGKSTLFTVDIPAWLTAKSRSIRGFIGSSTQTTANSYTGRLRSMLENNIPVQAKSEELALGLARDADSTLPADYGRFKPLHDPERSNPPWSKSQFTVEQYALTPTDEKEASWTAFGADTKFLGWRVNFIVWDDLVTRSSYRTQEAIEEQRMWWINEAETRLEPGGLLILQGQRLHAEDLYRFCLDMRVPVDEFDEDFFELGDDAMYTDQKKYFHIVYKAHYEDQCKATDTDVSCHKRSANPYRPNDPDSGCLLDPVRLPWRELKTVMEQPLTNFRVVYQQEDVSPEEVLVPQVWLDGGYDPETSDEYMGCYDTNRGPVEIPQGLAGTKYSIVTVDPSPTKFWSVQWWLYVEPHDQTQLMGTRYLLDLARRPMGSEDFLDFSMTTLKWTGLMEDWWHRSKRLGHPISHLIVEQNAAQRFMLKYDWFRRWLMQRSVLLKPHDTNANKINPDFGVKTIRSHYKFGRVRLPGDFEGKRLVAPMVAELTRYPDSTTDDCIMAHWFMEYQLQYIVKQNRDLPSLYNDIPSWVTKEPTYA